MKKARKLYESPAGDRWYLIREPSGGLFVRHESPDGEIEHVEIGAFLSTGDGPQKHALLGWIGTLVEEPPVLGNPGGGIRRRHTSWPLASDHSGKAGTTATVLEALATIDGRPAASITGKQMSDEPPTIAYKEARHRVHARHCVCRSEL